MEKKIIKLKGVEDIFCFTESAMSVIGDITVRRGKYVIDGKSKLGLLALYAPNEPIIVEYPENNETFDKFLKKYECN